LSPFAGFPRGSNVIQMGRQTRVAIGCLALVYAPATGFEGPPAFIKKNRHCTP
jgi:hypothetical protein